MAIGSGKMEVGKWGKFVDGWTGGESESREGVEEVEECVRREKIRDRTT